MERGVFPKGGKFMKILIIIFTVFMLVGLLNVKASGEWVLINSFTRDNSNPVLKSCNDSTYLLSFYYRTQNTDYDSWTAGRVFYLTTDYGMTWDTIYSNLKPYEERNQLDILEGMEIFSPDSILFMNAIEDSVTYMYHSYDGGKSWDSTLTPRIGRDWNGRMAINGQHSGGQYPFFHCESPAIYYYSLADTIIYTSPNYGRKWLKFSLPFLEDDYGAGYIHGSSDGLANNILITAYRDDNLPRFKKLLLNDNYIYHTWEVIDDDADEIEYRTKNFFFRTYREIWGLGKMSDGSMNTIVRRTTDRGQTWERLDNEQLCGGMGMGAFFCGPDSIFIRSSFNTFWSTDGGKSWAEKPFFESLQGASAFAMSSWNHRIMLSGIPGEDGSAIGIFRWEETSEVNDAVKLQPEIDLQLFPQPVNSGEILHMDLRDGQYNATILALDGRFLDLCRVESNSVQIPGDYSSGIYFLVIEADGEVIARETFMIR